MIGGEDISVVVQGPVDWSLHGGTSEATTKLLTHRLRELLPTAEIILSTWADSLVDGLVFDKLVTSKDPGPQSSWPSLTPNNVNRQITSTLAGLRVATRPYALKVRTDLILNGLDFIEVFSKLEPLNDEARDIFNFPIVVNNLTSRNTAAILARIPDHPLLFHPSDHVMFGCSEDLVMLWDIPLQTEEDAYHFVDRTYPNRWRQHELSRLCPEQHILTSAIGKKVAVDLVDFGSSSPSLIEMSDYYMKSHFRFIPDLKFPISFPKYHTDHHFSFEWMRYPAMYTAEVLQAPLESEECVDQFTPTPIGGTFMGSIKRMLGVGN